MEFLTRTEIRRTLVFKENQPMRSSETEAGRESYKAARFEARLTPEQKSILLRAAALTGRSLTDFVVTSAQEAATRTLREHEAMTLSLRDREVFVAALLKVPAPGKRLRKAAQRYKRHGVNAR
jgi:uncharacterized protein (DUF1778 family)